MTLSPRDDAALDLIHAEAAAALPRARAAATSWVAGLTAVAGVLGTATVVSTGTEVQDLAGWQLLAVGAAIVVGAFAVAFGVLRIYAAANVSALASGKTVLRPFLGLQDRADGTGAANAWESAVAEAVKDSESYRKQAVGSTLVGVAAMALALALTWLVPTDAGSAATTCIEVGGTELELDGDVPELVGGSYTVVPCG